MRTTDTAGRRRGPLATLGRGSAWPEGPLVGWGLLANLVWELAQSPLYADHAMGTASMLWTRLHCAVGDVLILLGAFWATAAVHGARRWPWTRGTAAAATFVAPVALLFLARRRGLPGDGIEGAS